MKVFIYSLLLALLPVISVTSAESIEPETIVASFGETPIYAEEMIFHIRDNLAMVAVHFKIKHGVDLSGKSWQENFRGETPLEMLKDRSIQSCRVSKAIQQQANERNAEKRPRFPGFAQDCEQINLTRVKALADGEVLYGLISYTPDQLYKYIITNMKNQLLNVNQDIAHGQRESEIRTIIRKKMNKMPPQLDDVKLNLLLAEQVGVIALTQQTGEKQNEIPN